LRSAPRRLIDAIRIHIHRNRNAWTNEVAENCGEGLCVCLRNLAANVSAFGLFTQHADGFDDGIFESIFLTSPHRSQLALAGVDREEFPRHSIVILILLEYDEIEHA